MSKKEVVIGFDPGNECTGWCVWDVKDKIFLYKHKILNGDVIQKIEVFDKKYNIVKVGIEYPSSYGMPVGQTLFDTCTFVGILAQIFKSKNIPCELIFRKSVKMFLCNSVRADDSIVNSRVREYLGEDNTKKKPNPIYWNEEVEENEGYAYMNGDIYASASIILYMIYPHDILIKNEKEQERNKISKELRLYLSE